MDKEKINKAMTSILQEPTSQNDQTQSHNSSAVVDILFGFV